MTCTCVLRGNPDSNIKSAVDQVCAGTWTGTAIAQWDVSGITSMENVFYGCTTFNQDISLCNTASVTNMNVSHFTFLFCFRLMKLSTCIWEI